MTTNWEVKLIDKEIIGKRNIYNCEAILFISGIKIIKLKISVKEDLNNNLKILSNTNWEVLYKEYLSLLRINLKDLIKGERYERM